MSATSKGINDGQSTAAPIGSALLAAVVIGGAVVSLLNWLSTERTTTRTITRVTIRRTLDKEAD